MDKKLNYSLEFRIYMHHKVKILLSGEDCQVSCIQASYKYSDIFQNIYRIKTI